MKLKFLALGVFFLSLFPLTPEAKAQSQSCFLDINAADLTLEVDRSNKTMKVKSSDTTVLTYPVNVNQERTPLGTFVSDSSRFYNLDIQTVGWRDTDKIDTPQEVVLLPTDPKYPLAVFHMKITARNAVHGIPGGQLTLPGLSENSVSDGNVYLNMANALQLRPCLETVYQGGGSVTTVIK